MADFFVDMGQISPRRQQLLTKQWSGNKCSDAPTQIQTSSYAMDHRDLSGKQWRAEHQACYCTRLTAHFSQTVKPFEGLLLLYFVFKMHPFFFKIVHYYVVIFSQNCCFVDNFVDKTIIFSQNSLFCRQFCWQNDCRRQRYEVLKQLPEVVLGKCQTGQFTERYCINPKMECFTCPMSTTYMSQSPFSSVTLW